VSPDAHTVHTTCRMQIVSIPRRLRATTPGSSPVGDAMFARRGAESARSLLAVANSACPASPEERHQSDQSAGRERRYLWGRSTGDAEQARTYLHIDASPAFERNGPCTAIKPHDASRAVAISVDDLRDRSVRFDLERVAGVAGSVDTTIATQGECTGAQIAVARRSDAVGIDQLLDRPVWTDAAVI
jgi:predicted flap endonuclease-1-like 5' DNA nuclease